MRLAVLAAVPLLMLPFPVRAAGPAKSGIDRRFIDRSVRPQDDLFQYVNGEWLKHTPIPPDKSNYGSFIVLIDEAKAKIRAIIEEAASEQHPPGSEPRKVGDFYKSYMDQARIQQRGLKPLKAELEKIDGLRKTTQVIDSWGRIQQIGVRTPIGFTVRQDSKNSQQYLAAVVQSGLSLPDRNYYLKDDKKFAAARRALREYIAKLYSLAKLEGGMQAAEAILKIETRLAEAHWERTELRNAVKRYNKYETAKLKTLTPRFPWKRYFAASRVPDLKEVNVMTPSYFEALEKIGEETPVSAWRHYLRFHLIDAYATALPKAFDDAHFELHAKTLAGIPQQKPRWRRAVEATAGARGFGVLGDAVGKLYVARHFTPEAKQRMDRLVKNLLVAYGASIRQLAWMTPETKKRALDKLSKIRTKIGYTKKWRDYEALRIDPADLVGNLMRSALHKYNRMLNKLGKPVDREEWGMTPQTVNAYYNPGMNEIVFPAAILQPPFFNPAADDAVNYGAIGAVIGHEISHAFDDQGSRYDGDGNLRNWWTHKDRAAFRKLTQRLVEQFSSYHPLEGKAVNGRLTLGENIADLSGLQVTYKAYRLSLNGREPPEIDGWSGDQRFFLGWGQIWQRKYRDAELVRRLLTDPHSPARYRANGPLANSDAFHRAFGLKPGDRLYKPEAERIRIW